MAPITARTATPDYEALYHQAPCGYLTTDDESVIVEVNDTFVAWSGRERATLLGARLPTLLPIGDQILYSTHCLPQLAVVGAVAEVAIEVVTGDGTRRSALLSATRVPARDGAPAEVRVVVFQAHERLAYERNLVAALRRAEESDARRATVEADLLHLTHHDALTGLPNRAGLVEHLRAAVGTVPLAVLLLDLDHFEALNHSLGHAAGDELLTLVAQRLRTAAPDARMVARLTGDEFVVALETDDAGRAAERARALLAAVEAPVEIEGLEIRTGAAVGIATATPGDAPDDLLRHAAGARRRAKQADGERVAVHDPARTDPAVSHLRLLGELRTGIAEGELRLHHQPRVELATGALDGVEALVRWQHPTRGLLPPSEFVDAAEQSGLIRSLGAWVLEDAIAQVGRWRAEDPSAPPIGMAVNLSTRQLTDRSLPEVVAGLLGLFEVDAGLLTLEITETSLVSDPDAVLDALVGLEALGVGLAVDDFGTGYSSLTYLKRFPIDELKIDRSFVAGLGQDDGDAAIVASCVHLAHAMGIRAVAEGVETEEQREVLVGLGCDLAQGYLFARPLPPEDLAGWRAARA